MATNLPIKKYRSGNIEAAVWLNKKEIDGQIMEFKTVTLSKSFKKKDEEIWRNEQINLRRNDLQKVMLVLNKTQQELFLINTAKEADDDGD